MKARIADLGYTAFSSSPGDFARFIAKETEKWAKVVKFAGFTAAQRSRAAAVTHSQPIIGLP
jgi:hypothetical protein